MGFEARVTFTYSGKPSDGSAKLKIVLADGTVLVATDDWDHYPDWGIALHPAFLPQRIVRARNNLLRELAGEHRNVKPEDIRARLGRNLAVGDKGLQVFLRYGRSTTPSRVVTFKSEVTQLVPM